jgi:hypothetical protein
MTTESVTASNNNINDSTLSLSPNILLFIFLITASFITGVMQNQWNPDVQPFTINEWFYATQDGYLDVMIQHYIRNGGL